MAVMALKPVGYITSLSLALLLGSLSLVAQAADNGAQSPLSSQTAQTKRFLLPLDGENKEEGKQDHTHSDDYNDAEAAEIPRDAFPSLEPTDPDAEPVEDDTAEIQKERTRPVPAIQRDVSLLPPKVRTMRAAILSEAKKGNLEGLRALIGTGENATNLSLNEEADDPIGFLKAQSGDDEGFEILGILVDVLEAGFVHLKDSPDEEIYVWPYFFAVPFEKLTPTQKVELFQVLTAGDMEESREMGSYVFYRVGIKPDGRWDFFMAGS